MRNSDAGWLGCIYGCECAHSEQRTQNSALRTAHSEQRPPFGTWRGGTVPFSMVGVVASAVWLLIARTVSHRANCPTNSPTLLAKSHKAAKAACTSHYG